MAEATIWAPVQHSIASSTGVGFQGHTVRLQSFQPAGDRDRVSAAAHRALGIRSGAFVFGPEVPAANHGSPGGVGPRSSVEDQSFARWGANGRGSVVDPVERLEGALS